MANNEVPSEINSLHLDEEASVLTGEYYGDSNSNHNGQYSPDMNSNAGSSAQHRYSHYRAWVEKKMESRRIEEEQHLTFKPKLHEYKGNVPTNPEEGSRFDRLYKDARKRHVEAKMIKAQSEEPQTSFQPQLATRSSSRGKRAPSPQPVHERLHTQTGAGNLKQVHKEDPPFHPAVTRKALEVSRSHNVDVADRLYQKSFEMKEKHDKKRAEQDKIQNTNEDCTFAPKLTSNTRSLSASRARRAVGEGEAPPSSAAERLLKYEEQKKARLEMLRQTKLEVESSEITFSPNIGVSAKIGYKTNTPNQTVFDRLNKESTAFNRVHSPENPECTFKPEIPRTSRDMTVPTCSNFARFIINLRWQLLSSAA
jgi:hypothetical protein